MGAGKGEKGLGGERCITLSSQSERSEVFVERFVGRVLNLITRRAYEIFWMGSSGDSLADRSFTGRAGVYLDERCAGFARWSVPEGGFFLWLELAEGIDPERLRYTANEEAVGIVGGSAFFEDGSGANRVRLCYGNVAERDIPEAIMRFGRALERAVRA